MRHMVIFCFNKFLNLINKEVPIPEKQAKCFIDGLHAVQIKWSILDPSTLHSGFHVANIKNYNELRGHHQIGCRESASITI